MSTTTADDKTIAQTLGHQDRAAFDADYTAWLERDEIDGAPDYTAHFKSHDDALRAILGKGRTEDIRHRLDWALENDDLATNEMLEDQVEALTRAYAEGFGPLPK